MAERYSMENAINIAMFEFAKTCQDMVKLGWEFGEIQYGEERLGIGPKLTIKRGDESYNIYHYNEMKTLLYENNCAEDNCTEKVIWKDADNCCWCDKHRHSLAARIK